MFYGFLGVCFVLGGLVVVSNLSPYYGVVGLVLASFVGCGWLVSLGMSFVSLVLFLVYLGAMLVGFVYSVSLAAEPFPEAWGDWGVIGYSVGLIVVLVMGLYVTGLLGCLWAAVSTVDGGDVFSVRLDSGGVDMSYFWGVGQLLVAAWGLLLTLLS